MSGKQRIAICVAVVLSVVAQDLKSQHAGIHREMTLSAEDVSYIYNRSFDIALRDRRAGLMARSIYLSSQFVNFDSMIITIDPILTSTAFDTKYIQPLREKDYDDTLGIQGIFDEALIINTGDIVYKHYEQLPTLTGNHLLHVEFSDLYAAANSLYLGIRITFQSPTNQGFYNWQEWVLFELEWCNDRFVMFRKFYIPMGVFDSDTPTYYSKELFDRGCQ